MLTHISTPIYKKKLLLQSPLGDAELQGLATTDEAVPTPEPVLETEIEIASEAGAHLWFILQYAKQSSDRLL